MLGDLLWPLGRRKVGRGFDFFLPKANQVATVVGQRAKEMRTSRKRHLGDFS